MLDPKFVREHIDIVKKAIADKGEKADLGPFLELDARRREILQRVEALKAQRNTVSDQIAQLKKAKSPDADARIAEMREVGDKIKAFDEELRGVEEKLSEATLSLPNIPDPAVPVGASEKDNVVDRVAGDEKKFGFAPKPHWEIGEQLGIIDFERGVKLSGTRFYVLKELGARLQRALIAWMLDVHTREHGYREVYPPYIVNHHCLVGTGQLPKFADNLYHDAEEDFWLIPTAEVPVINLYRGEVIEGAALPVKHVAYTPCFRREKMSAGKDVRGIKRGHQFDKVEMVKFCLPERSAAELDALVADACEILARLGLRYRVVQLCTADLTFASARTYDIEVWAPGCNEWLEVSSCSNCGEFQSRRANIKFRRDAKAKPEYVHALNGSGLALPRTLIAVLENFQNADGSVTIPDVLRPFMGTDVIK
ncbi:MAG TPA: serine--tRNA ligase [Candidatus Edwardsbacteria bacterium]|nr:serine--tRNA ligase [Candidatus Edwardsbacteria bacterium]